jgi:pyridinium-3,5-bisthiocarboxylic acid mononucleotide nickel chelatase
MKIAYFDCFAGASGGMILGALLGAGLELDTLRHALAGLSLPDWQLSAAPVMTAGLSATRVTVLTKDASHGRAYSELNSLLSASRIPPDARDMSLSILRRIAEVESSLHNTALEEVYLHELGGTDTLIDIVGAVLGLKFLDVGQVFVSALPMGGGSVASRHGTLPLPAPAMIELARGAPIRAVDIQAELVTPTGAAILTTLARGYSSFPPMTLTSVGYGAGVRDLPIPNILRVLIGAPSGTRGTQSEPLVELETNIDDMNPQMYQYAMTRLFQAGALDVWLTPIQMKKERAGILLSALCRHEDASEMTRLMFEETTTLGIRRREVQRESLARETVTVGTSFGPVRVKVALLDGRVLRARPEYEDCRKLAESCHVPLPEIYGAAEAGIDAALKSKQKENKDGTIYEI